MSRWLWWWLVCLSAFWRAYGCDISYQHTTHSILVGACEWITRPWQLHEGWLSIRAKTFDNVKLFSTDGRALGPVGARRHVCLLTIRMLRGDFRERDGTERGPTSSVRSYTFTSLEPAYRLYISQKLRRSLKMSNFLLDSLHKLKGILPNNLFETSQALPIACRPLVVEPQMSPLI